MEKIISLFQRNYDTDRLVRDEIVPGAEWVVAGEGMATRKWDGTPCMLRGGLMYKRHELKPGKAAPDGFEPSQEPDPVTGEQPGWVPVGDGPEGRWFREARENSHAWMDGTYELVGPRVNGNPDGFESHWLMRHGRVELEDAPRTFLVVELREHIALRCTLANLPQDTPVILLCGANHRPCHAEPLRDGLLALGY